MDRTSHTEGCVFTRRGEAWCEATRLEEGVYRVRLGGPFQAAWMVGLSNRLAERNISIDHTHARQGAEDFWIAELHLLEPREGLDLLSVDYLELAQSETTLPAGPFELESFRLLESRDYGGTLMLTCEARDSLGLLGALLSALAELGLFPLELHIETRGGRAFDCLWLAAVHGARPSPAMHEATEALLSRSRSPG